MNPKNIRALIALSVNGAVIHVVCPVVDRATMERGKIIPRQHVVKLENRLKKGDSGRWQVYIFQIRKYQQERKEHKTQPTSTSPSTP